MKTFITTTLLFLSIALFSQSWQQLSDFPGVERDDAVSFVIGNTAYCGSGLSPWWAPMSDFYAFDMDNETWSAIAPMPAGEERQYASSFARGNLGFVLLGVNDGYLNDVWQYDANTNNWTEKAPLPAEGRSGAAAFIIEDTAYIIGGKTANNQMLNEVWAYDVQNDTWESKNDFPFASFWRASADATDSKGYLTFGVDNDGNYIEVLYEYDPATDSWTAISEFPSSGRSYSAMQAMNDHLYIVAGIDPQQTYYSDVWRYNIVTSVWSELNPIPSIARKGGVTFNNNLSLYYSTGIDLNNIRLSETWKLSNVVGLSEKKASDGFNLYPNPAHDIVLIEIAVYSPSSMTSYSVYDSKGRLLFKNRMSQKVSAIPISDLSQGLYFVHISNTGGTGVKKFVKR